MQTFFTSRVGVTAVPSAAEFNPYAPPEAPVADSDEILQLATGGRRFANLLLDKLFQYVLLAMVGVAVALAGHEQWLENWSWGWDRLVGAVFFVLYYFVQECLWGTTLGKLITRTRVLTETGGTPTAGQILKRTLARLVPFEAFSFLGKEPVGWHDKWSRTRVFLVRRGVRP